MTVIICPKPFDSIVRASEEHIGLRNSEERRKSIGYTETPGGAWCSDSYRVHYSCPSEELPDHFKKYAAMEGKETGYLLVDKNFTRWLRHCTTVAGKGKTADLHLTADGWEWKTDFYEFTYRQPAPVLSDRAGLNAEFLRDALLFMEAEGKVVTFAATPEKREPWLLGYNGRSAIIMPLVLRP
jgi:hypothetical protein